MSDSKKVGQANSLRSARSSAYPFTALVGQEEMKLALVLSVIDPLLGGVLIMGHRGTGKSTAVRALAELLPQISIVRGCSYRCDPIDAESLCVDCQTKRDAGEKLSSTKARVAVVDLPLGATEDRVCGSIDIERALNAGSKFFEPGILARANRGFLYIDEVNLLEDHLVDLLLDVAVTGRNLIERESISLEHPARFVLVGSGNPEEGELRPQLLDRFGLNVEVTTESDVDRRTEIVERRERFESDREGFLAAFENEQDELRRKITKGQKLFGSVAVDHELLRKIAQLCAELNLDGHRGELTITRAARALAAFEGRKKMREADVKRVAPMALRHRLRRQPFDGTGSSERIEQALDKVFESDKSLRGSDAVADRNKKSAQQTEQESGNTTAAGAGTRTRENSPEFQLSSPDQGNNSYRFDFRKERTNFRGRPAGSNSRRKNQLKGQLNDRSGRYVSSTLKAGSSVAIDATLRALCLQRSTRDGNRSFPSHALRYKQFRRRHGSLYILVIDASGSMAMRRINRAREVALGILSNSYINRDSVAVIVFRGNVAEVVLPPSRSILRAKRALDSLTVGGGTPLSTALWQSIELVKQDRQQHGEPVVLLFTDGRANVTRSLSADTDSTQRKKIIESELSELGRELHEARITTVVIEVGERFITPDDAGGIATRLGAQLVRLS
jgi:magnesium chelatase subunit D